MRKQRGNKAGFTFLELMVAVVVLVLGVLITLGMFARASLTLKKNKELSIANLLAQKVMERTIYQTSEEIQTNSVTVNPSGNNFLNFSEVSYKNYKYKVELGTPADSVLSDFSTVKVTILTPLGSEVDLVGLKSSFLGIAGDTFFVGSGIAEANQPWGGGMYTTYYYNLYAGDSTVSSGTPEQITYLENLYTAFGLTKGDWAKYSKAVRWFCVSSDKKKLIYLVHIANPRYSTDWNAKIFIQDIGEENAQILTLKKQDGTTLISNSAYYFSGILDPKFSPNGEKFSLVYNNKLYITNLEGQIEKEIPVFSPTISQSPNAGARIPTVYSWDPQGEYVIYSSGNAIKKYTVNNEETLVQFDREVVSPVYSPNGEEIVALVKPPQGYVNPFPNASRIWDIMIIKATDGSIIRQIMITATTPNYTVGPAAIIQWNPDGNSFLIRADSYFGTYASVLMQVNANGTYGNFMPGGYYGAYNSDGSKLLTIGYTNTGYSVPVPNTNCITEKPVLGLGGGRAISSRIQYVK